MTIVLGGFGDVVRYACGDLLLSWYPVGCLGIERRLTPSPAPPAGPGPWRVVLEGHHFSSRAKPPGEPCAVEWCLGPGEVYRRETVPAGEVVRVELIVEDIRQRQQLRLRFPDAALLADEGIGDDPRRVGFGLRRVQIVSECRPAELNRVFLVFSEA